MHRQLEKQGRGTNDIVGNPGQTFRARESLGIEAISLKLIYNHLSGFFSLLFSPIKERDAKLIFI